MNRHTIALAGAATAVLWRRGDRDRGRRRPDDDRRVSQHSGTGSSASSSTPTPASATRRTSRGTSQGPAGPGAAGRPAPRALPARRVIPARASARSTSSPAPPARRSTARPATSRSASTATDLITLTCETGAPPPPPPTGDVPPRDQRGRLRPGRRRHRRLRRDREHRHDRRRRSTGSALVLVNGGDGTEYGRKALTGTLAAGAKLVVDVDPQNGAPDGLALVDTATTRCSTRSATRGRSPPPRSARKVFDLVEGTVLPGRRRRLEHGRRHARAHPRRQRTADNAAADWAFTTTPTPGAANVKTP